MDVVLPVAFVVAMSVITVIAVMFDDDKWKKQAKELGLSYDGGGLYGDYRGVEVRVNPSTVGTGRQRRNYTEYKAKISDVPAGLTMISDVSRSMSGNPFVGLDINVGIPVVDENFIIETAEREATGEFLHRPGVVEALNILRSAFIYVRLERGEILVKTRGFDSTPAMMRSLDDLAKGINKMRLKMPDPQTNKPQTKPVPNPDKQATVPLETDGHW